jgi:hypothetical protein
MKKIDFEAIEKKKFKYLEVLSAEAELADTLDFKRGSISLWAGGMKNGPLGRWPNEQEYQDRVKFLKEKIEGLISND